MQILYKQATKQYIHYDASARRSDLVSDVNEATEMANDLAVSILNRCSKKLKGFESIPAESVKKSASSTLSNSSVKIIKTPRRRFTAKERRDIYIRDKRADVLQRRNAAIFTYGTKALVAFVEDSCRLIVLPLTISFRYLKEEPMITVIFSAAAANVIN